MAKDEPRGPDFEASLARLRSELADWPGVSESLSWGNPTFKANGKSFAVLDRYHGRHCVWVRCAGERRDALLNEPGIFPAPYDKRKQAICRDVDGLAWDDFRAVLRESYESVMPG